KETFAGEDAAAESRPRSRGAAEYRSRDDGHGRKETVPRRTNARREDRLICGALPPGRPGAKKHDTRRPAWPPGGNRTCRVRGRSGHSRIVPPLQVVERYAP